MFIARSSSNHLALPHPRTNVFPLFDDVEAKKSRPPVRRSSSAEIDRKSNLSTHARAREPRQKTRGDMARGKKHHGPNTDERRTGGKIGRKIARTNARDAAARQTARRFFNNTYIDANVHGPSFFFLSSLLGLDKRSSRLSSFFFPLPLYHLLHVSAQKEKKRRTREREREREGGKNDRDQSSITSIEIAFSLSPRVLLCSRATELIKDTGMK